jgi:hypothetical protein
MDGTRVIALRVFLWIVAVIIGRFHHLIVYFLVAIIPDRLGHGYQSPHTPSPEWSRRMDFLHI